MSDPWNEPPPCLDSNFRTRIIKKTDEYLTMVQWKENGQPANLEEAIKLAKQGIDGGKELTLSFRPTGFNFNDWMAWSSLVSFLYNRDTQVRTILSAIRNAIYNTRLLHFNLLQSFIKLFKIFI